MSSEPPPHRLMGAQTLSNWFQVGASLAVVFSIGLLVFELEQQRELAQAQFIVDAQGLRMATDVAVLGEEMGSVLSRACFTPEALTADDLIKLDLYFGLRLAGIATLLDAETLGGAERPTWNRRLKTDFVKIWGYEIGQAWWRDQKGWNPQIRQVASELEAQGRLEDPKRCGQGEFYSRVR